MKAITLHQPFASREPVAVGRFTATAIAGDADYMEATQIIDMDS